MEIGFNLFLFLSGLFLLISSSDYLIQASVKLSLLFKVTPLFIGLVVVAFGTSSPEAGIGIIAAILNQKEIALGNIVGSNIANIGLILGLCALLRPLEVEKTLLKRELSIMMICSFLLYLAGINLSITRKEGTIFIFFFVIFLIISYQEGKKSFHREEVNNFKFHKIFTRINSRFLVSLITLLSLGGITGGAYLMVKGGVALAKIFGISSWIIGITVFAIGTSLPELIASLTASFKKVPSISVGNIVGSNIFNILFVLGIVSLIRPINLSPSILKFELPLLIIFSLLLFTVAIRGYKITRKEGLIMFTGYIIFLLFVAGRG